MAPWKWGRVCVARAKSSNPAGDATAAMSSSARSASFCTAESAMRTATRAPLRQPRDIDPKMAVRSRVHVSRAWLTSSRAYRRREPVSPVPNAVASSPSQRKRSAWCSR